MAPVLWKLKIRLTDCDCFEYSAPPVGTAIVRGSGPAQVAELVDARRSGRRVLTDVRVRVSPWAPSSPEIMALEGLIGENIPLVRRH